MSGEITQYVDSELFGGSKTKCRSECSHFQKVYLLQSSRLRLTCSVCSTVISENDKIALRTLELSDFQGNFLEKLEKDLLHKFADIPRLSATTVEENKDEIEDAMMDRNEFYHSSTFSPQQIDRYQV
jgi:hypothetical protein